GPCHLQRGGGGCPRREDEALQRGQAGVVVVDEALEPVDVGLVGGSDVSARLDVERGRQVGAQVEQQALHLGQVAFEGPQRALVRDVLLGRRQVGPGQTDGGVGLVDGAVGDDAQVVLGN